MPVLLRVLLGILDRFLHIADVFAGLADFLLNIALQLSCRVAGRAPDCFVGFALHLLRYALYLILVHADSPKRTTTCRRPRSSMLRAREAAARAAGQHTQ